MCGDDSHHKGYCPINAMMSRKPFLGLDLWREYKESFADVARNQLREAK